VLEEQELPIRNARQPGPEAPRHALLCGLILDRVGVFLPVDAVGRIGQHVVEAPVGMRVLSQRVAICDVLGVVAGDQHVGFADREGLGVELLAEELDADAVVERLHLHLGDGQHSACARRRVIDLPDHAGAGESVLVVDQQQ